MTVTKPKVKRAKDKKPKLTANDLRERLGAKFPDPEWVVLNEVRNATGWDGNRSADCMALGTWPSRGFVLFGFEIKVSRSDVLKELRDPKKADSVSRYCDRWYLVLGDKALIKESEVPKKWGVLVPHGNGLRIQKEAPLNSKIKAWPKGFVASMVRNAHRDKASTRALKAEYERGREIGKDQASYQAHRDAEDLKKLRGQVKEFQEWSGVTTLLDAYSYEGKRRKEATLLRTIMASGAGSYHEDMAKLVLQMETLSRKVREDLVETGVLEKDPGLDGMCPHPQRHGRHEVYVETDAKGRRKKAGGMNAFCRACGAKGVIGK